MVYGIVSKLDIYHLFAIENNKTMKRNFFKISMRYLWRNKTYSILNFLCLTFGLSCAILAVLFTLNIFSWDKFHKNYERIFSVEAYVTYFNGDCYPKQYTSASLNDVLSGQVPEIDEMTRTVNRTYSFEYNNKSFTEIGIFADPTFLNVFTFPLKQGNPQALTDLHSILISERMANKFFENSDCLGKTLILKDEDRKENR